MKKVFLFLDVVTLMTSSTLTIYFLLEHFYSQPENLYMLGNNLLVLTIIFLLTYSSVRNLIRNLPSKD